MEYLGLVASFAMGIALGLLGGGGSILTVPILVYLFSVPPTIATGYSLLIVGMSALIGSLMYLRKGEVAFQTGMTFAFPSVIGVNISRGVVLPQIPEIIFAVGKFSITKEVLVMVTFAILMIAASFSMIKKRSEREPMQSSSIKKLVLIALQGLVVGLIAGFVGAGGGFLIIPVLVFIAGLPMRMAIGTSLMIIAMQSLLGFAGDVSRGFTVDQLLLVKVAVFAILGIVTGSAIAHKMNEQKLKWAFGWFVLVMGMTILIEQIRHLSM